MEVVLFFTLPFRAIHGVPYCAEQNDTARHRELVNKCEDQDRAKVREGGYDAVLLPSWTARRPDADARPAVAKGCAKKTASDRKPFLSLWEEQR